MKPANDSWVSLGPQWIPNHRFVVIGGGSGLAPLLEGLRGLCFKDGMSLTAEDKARLTGIVSVADDGGSSGILRRAYHVLAPGDIRNCLVALAADKDGLRKLFDFRFNEEVDQHSLGNLILTALSQLEGDFTHAVDKAGELLNIQGRILPATQDDVALLAEFCDGTSTLGESSIASCHKRIRQINLVPPTIRPLPQTIDAIMAADTIILGPGSLYTSLIPNLLVPGIADAIRNSGARVVLVMNLMTEPGETDYYDPADFLYAIRRHVPQLPVHYTLVNNAPIPAAALQRYAEDDSHPITLENSRKQIDSYCVPVFGDLLADDEKIRHDPEKLTSMLCEICSPASSRQGYSPVNERYVGLEML